MYSSSLLLACCTCPAYRYTSAAYYSASSQSQVKVTLRLTVGHSVSLGVEPHLGLMTIYFIVWQLRSCFCGAPSLTRELVCLLYKLLVLASAVFLGSESLGSHDHFYCLSFETALFVASYDSQGHGGGIRPHSAHRCKDHVYTEAHTGFQQLTDFHAQF
jgi:hypothetical protein